MNSSSIPLALCSSTVAPPPEKAYLFTLSFICLGVSLVKMADVVSLALIFPVSPCTAQTALQVLKPSRSCTDTRVLVDSITMTTARTELGKGRPQPTLTSCRVSRQVVDVCPCSPRETGWHVTKGGTCSSASAQQLIGSACAERVHCVQLLGRQQMLAHARQAGDTAAWQVEGTAVPTDLDWKT